MDKLGLVHLPTSLQETTQGGTGLGGKTFNGFFNPCGVDEAGMERSGGLLFGPV
jgi:hypothetical protein